MFNNEFQRMQRPENKQGFISRMYEGLTVAESCAMMRINPAVLAMVREEDPQFDIAIRKAQAFRVDMDVDKLASIHDAFSDPLMARVVSDNIKWLASKRLKEIYGDRVDIHVTKQINIRAAIDDAKQRVIDYNGAIPLNTLPIHTDNISVRHPELLDDDDDVDPLSD